MRGKINKLCRGRNLLFGCLDKCEFRRLRTLSFKSIDINGAFYPNVTNHFMGVGSSIPKSRTGNIIDQSGLAEKLSKKKPLVLVFVSPNCSLCADIALKIANVGAAQRITNHHSIAHPALRHLISSTPHFSLYRPLTLRTVQI